MKLKSIHWAAASILLGAVLAEPAAADDNKFYLKLGSSTLVPMEGATIAAGGSIVPGGTISLANHTTLGLEAGYHLTPNWSVGLAAGVPPTIDIYGAGSLAGLGKLGTITYGPAALTAQYTFTNFGRIQPYVGAGPLYMFVFSNKGGAVENLKVDPAWGAVVHAGVDVDLTDHWGVYVDVKKSFLRTAASGTLGAGGPPILADVKLDPWVFGTGLKYRF